MISRPKTAPVIENEFIDQYHPRFSTSCGFDLATENQHECGYNDYNVDDDVEVLSIFIKQKVSEVCQNLILKHIQSLDKDEINDTGEVQKENQNDVDIQKSCIPNIDDLMKQCETKAKDILTSSWMKMQNTMQNVHNKENERKNHMRYHYDDKLNKCRVSYQLQNNHRFQVLQLRKLEDEAEMQGFYESKIEELTSKLYQANDVIRVQERTVVQSQTKAHQVEKELEETKQSYNSYKSHMTEKYNTLEESWNRIKKQEIWAHFKIIRLKKKVKKCERSLNIKKTQQKKLLLEIKDLTDRLRVSMEIRTGMEKAFEKRARIRGRLDIVNQQEVIRSFGTPQLSCRKECNTTTQQKRVASISRSCQTQESENEVEMKEKGIDASPFLDNSLKALKYRTETLQAQLVNEREESMMARRQNEGYKRLISGKNLALILATEQKTLFERPNSIEAKLLFELTQPKGILVEKKPLCNESCSEQRQKQKKDEDRVASKPNDRNGACSIPAAKSNQMTGFVGLKGTIIDTRKKEL